MRKPAMTQPQAKLELVLLQAEADLTSNSDVYISLTEMGLPPEVAIRLKELLEVLKRVGDKIVSIGKIIVLKLIAFVEKHPNLAAGIALGAAVSALMGAIPLIGIFLAPLAISLGIAVGAIAGHRIDKQQSQRMSGDFAVIDIAQDVIEIAGAFFQLFIETMQVVSVELGK